MTRLSQTGEGAIHWTTDFRDVPPDEVMRVAGCLLVGVSERHGPEVGAHVAQGLLVSGRDGAYQVWCDQERHGLTVDEAREFLWVAAGLGHEEAEHALDGLVLNRPRVRRPGLSGRNKGSTLSHAERSEFGEGLMSRPEDGCLDNHDTPDPDLAGLDLGPGRSASVAVPQAASAAVPLPGRVVIPRIGDPESANGKELVKRFKGVVGESLPFAGQVPALDVVTRAIRERWPWASRAADQLERHMSVLRTSGTTELRLQPMLFVGDPGCGKTSVARYLATLLDVPSIMVSCGGTADAGGLGAVTRGWSTSRPSVVTLAYADHRCANPMAILDEIDKSSQVGSHNGSVQGTLLQMIGAEDFTDTCIMGPVDMRSTSFVATANHLPRIDPGLLERFELISFDAPSPEHFNVLLDNCRSDFARQYEMSVDRVPVLDGADRRVLREQWMRRRRSARVFARIHETIVKDILLMDERARLAEETERQARIAVLTSTWETEMTPGFAN